jgi:predicted component of type VI protein secretion system
MIVGRKVPERFLSPEFGRMPAYLMPVGDGPPIVLDKAIILIGRHPDCDVVLKRSRKVSRKHCCLAQVNSHFVVRDLGSMNGVRVNGNRIDSESALSFGDELIIGDVRYHLQDRRGRPQPKAQIERPAAHPADARHPSRPSPPYPPPPLSQDVPVAIPDEDRNWAVEPSLRQTPDAEQGFPQQSADDSNWFEGESIDMSADEPSEGNSEPFFGSGEFDDSGEFRGHGSHVELLPD